MGFRGAILLDLRVDTLLEEEELTVLGVTFNSLLFFSQHMQNLTAEAATLLYALETLKAHGLQGRALWDVTPSTLMAQITYVSPLAEGLSKQKMRRNLFVFHA